MQYWEELVVVIVFTYNIVIVFSLLYIISCISYAKLSSHVLTIWKKERAAVNMQGIVFP